MIPSMVSRPKSICVLAGVLATLWTASNFVALSQSQPQGSRKKESKLVLVSGKDTFESACATCHGLDGRGGEHAPNIADGPKVQRLSDVQLFKIVEDGIPGTGMPAFHSLETSHIKAVVTYLRTLQGTGKRTQLPGDRAHGETIFFGRAGCSQCHIVAGKGGFIASDLSAYARTHTVEQIRNEITNPANNDRRARMATATLHSGEKYTGRVRNEDNFSVQLQTLDGIFYSLVKSELEDLEYNSQSLMPSNYSSTLSPAELNDVISYLMSLSDASPSPPKMPKKEFEEE